MAYNGGYAQGTAANDVEGGMPGTGAAAPAAPGTGTGYNNLEDPYAAPQKAPKKHRLGKICCGILACLCCLLITAIVALGILVLVLYIVLKPSDPDVSVTNSQVQNFNVTTGGRVSGTILLTVQVINHNKVALHIKNSTVATYFQSVNLGNTTIPAFTVSKHSTSNITGSSNFSTQLPSNETGTFLADYQANAVPLKSLIFTKGDIDIWGVTSPKVEVDIQCTYDLNVQNQQVSNRICAVTRTHV